MDMGLRGNTYVVVGGTKGMGWQAARRLAAALEERLEREGEGEEGEEMDFLDFVINSFATI